jgi:hypothetical protein
MKKERNFVSSLLVTGSKPGKFVRFDLWCFFVLFVWETQDRFFWKFISIPFINYFFALKSTTLWDTMKEIIHWSNWKKSWRIRFESWFANNASKNQISFLSDKVWAAQTFFSGSQIGSHWISQKQIYQKIQLKLVIHFPLQFPQNANLSSLLNHFILHWSSTKLL